MNLFDTAPQSLLESEELYRFIEANAAADPAAIRLRTAGGGLNFDPAFAITQIECRRRCRIKLGKFISNPGFLFPSDLAAQQASDQLVAEQHARLLPSGGRWLDLTAGLGIDALSAAMAGHEVTAVEIESWKCDVLRHNAEVMLGNGASRFEVMCADALQVAAESAEDEFDIIFIDPARRGNRDQRLYSLADCMPDVTQLMPRLLKIAPAVAVKASPMLDVTEALRQLPDVAEVEAVSVRGECKELLIVCRRNAPAKPRIAARMISADGRVAVFEADGYSDSKAAATGGESPEEVKYGPGWYICEPDAAVQKLDTLIDLPACMPQLRKADANTRLYLSPELMAGFPGRVSRVISRISAKELKKMKGEKLTVVSRNYPEKADAIRSRYRFGESDNRFLYAFRLNGRPVMMLSEKIQL